MKALDSSDFFLEKPVMESDNVKMLSMGFGLVNLTSQEFNFNWSDFSNEGQPTPSKKINTEELVLV